jgi:hypothetical protein
MERASVGSAAVPFELLLHPAHLRVIAGYHLSLI